MCYHLFDIQNGLIIKNYSIKFVECESSSQTKENFEVSNNKSLDTLFKIEFINFISNSKSETKDVVGIIENGNGQQYPIVEPSCLIKKIQLQALVLGHKQISTTVPLSLPPILPSPVLT